MHPWNSFLQVPQHYGPTPDDSGITTRLPSICVDYLSHDWAEEDTWASWKAMTRHKSEIANGQSHTRGWSSLGLGFEPPGVGKSGVRWVNRLLTGFGDCV